MVRRLATSRRLQQRRRHRRRSARREVPKAKTEPGNGKHNGNGNNNRNKIRGIPKLIDYLRGRRVILVGPAGHLNGAGLGSLIDDHDIVVRLNKSLPIPESSLADLGIRTDILYSCLDPEVVPNLYSEAFKAELDALNFICCPYSASCHGQYFNKYLKRAKKEFGSLVSFHAVKSKKYDSRWADIEKHFQCRWCTSGTMTILDLLSYPIQSLTIIGLTFYQTSNYYYSDYRTLSDLDTRALFQRSGTHNTDGEFQYMSEIIKKDTRIKIDWVLQSLLHLDDHDRVINSPALHQINPAYLMTNPPNLSEAATTTTATVTPNTCSDMSSAYNKS